MVSNPTVRRAAARARPRALRMRSRIRRQILVKGDNKDPNSY